MKKILAFILASAMMLSVASCGSKDNTSSNNASQGSSEISSEVSEETKEYTGTLTDLIDGIYKDITFQFAVGEPIAIDLTNADALPYYLGITDSDAFTEAYFSEAMMGSQAYSLCVAKLADAANAEAVAKEVSEKTNMNKWICVGATDLMVLTYGDVLMMVMIDDNLGVSEIGAFRTAFESTCGGEADFVFERSQEM